MRKIIKNEISITSIQEFHSRWSKARMSAIEKSFKMLNLPNVFLELGIESEMIDGYFSAPFEENQKCSLLLKNIFDFSRHLALSFSKFLNLTFEIHDFRRLLQNSTIPCMEGDWEKRENAQVLVRKGCNVCTKAGANVCDYWREAIDGLVMGLGETERFARHASKRHGDAVCLDIIFNDDIRKKSKSLAYGPVPEHMVLNLKNI